jgi:Na+-translocating ferredoxin:NAD+ oxidoreductase RnfC subunit
MNAPVIIKKDYDIKLSATVHDYLNPNFIYLPIEDSDELKIKINDFVLKDQNIYDTKNSSVYSPISGHFIGYAEFTDCYNNSKKCLVIENDFKEKTIRQRGIKKKITDYRKDEIKEILKKFNLNFFNQDKINTLVINSIESEPYVATELFLMINYTYEILETIDSLLEVFSIKKAILTAKTSANEIVSKCMDYLGTFPNIKLRLLDDYP